MPQYALPTRGWTQGGKGSKLDPEPKLKRSKSADLAKIHENHRWGHWKSPSKSQVLLTLEAW